MQGKESAPGLHSRSVPKCEGLRQREADERGNIQAGGAACWLLAVTRQSSRAGINPERKARVPRHWMHNEGYLQSVQDSGQLARAEGGRGAFPRLPGGGGPHAAWPLHP